MPIAAWRGWTRNAMVVMSNEVQTRIGRKMNGKLQNHCRVRQCHRRQRWLWRGLTLVSKCLPRQKESIWVVGLTGGSLPAPVNTLKAIAVAITRKQKHSAGGAGVGGGSWSVASRKVVTIGLVWWLKEGRKLVGGKPKWRRL